MEQAHTQLIAQLNERISAADNTPLYMKFAQTVKNAVRSGILEHGNILPGERDLSQLTGVSRITVRKAMQALEEEGVVTRARGYGTQINNIFEYSLKEARGFSQQVVLRGKKPDTLWVNKRIVPCPEEVAQQLAVAVESCSEPRTDSPPPPPPPPLFMAPRALTRPWATKVPTSSQLPSIADRTCAGVAFGPRRLKTSPASPATPGQAMDVPLI